MYIFDKYIHTPRPPSSCSNRAAQAGQANKPQSNQAFTNNTRERVGGLGIDRVYLGSRAQGGVESSRVAYLVSSSQAPPPFFQNSIFYF